VPHDRAVPSRLADGPGGHGDQQQERAPYRLLHQVRRRRLRLLPIGDLYKTEVRQLAREIGIPDAIIREGPVSGLWEGQTDEGEMGIIYDELDQVLFGFERSLGDAAVAAETGVPLEKVQRIRAMHLRTAHKRKTPLIPKLGVRTLGIDWRE
jgi:NAD+ synthase